MPEQAPRPRVVEGEIDCNRPFLESLDEADRVRVGVCVGRQDTAQYRAYIDALRACGATKVASSDEQRLYRVMRQELPDQPEILKLFTDCRPADISDYREALRAAQTGEAPTLPWWRRKSVRFGLAALMAATVVLGHHFEDQTASSPSRSVSLPTASSTIPAPSARSTPVPSVSPTPVSPTTAPAPAPAPVPSSPANPASKQASFRIASLNSLGASHTDNRNGKDYHKMPKATVRAAGEAAFIMHQHLDIVGLQEFQPPQRQILLQKIGDKYDIYPVHSNYPESVNSIIWRQNKFRLVSAGKTMVHYFGGKMTPMPWVILKSTETGQEVRVDNTHDPADTANHHRQAIWRGKDALIHRAEAKQLKASGLAAFITGDFNSRLDKIRRQDRYLIGNHFSHLPLRILTAGGLAEDAIRHTNIDHIFFIPQHVTIRDYRVQHLPPGITDHPVVWADVTIH